MNDWTQGTREYGYGRSEDSGFLGEIPDSPPEVIPLSRRVIHRMALQYAFAQGFEHGCAVVAFSAGTSALLWTAYMVWTGGL